MLKAGGRLHGRGWGLAWSGLAWPGLAWLGFSGLGGIWEKRLVTFLKSNWFYLGNRDPIFQVFSVFYMVNGIYKYQKIEAFVLEDGVVKVECETFSVMK